MSASTKQTHRRDGALVLVLLVLALLGSMRLYTLAQGGVGLDFYQFWAVGRAIQLSPITDIYSADGRSIVAARMAALAVEQPQQARLGAAVAARPELELFASPLFYAAYGLLARLDYERAHWLHFWLSLFAGFAAVALWGRMLGYRLAMLAAALAVYYVAFAPLAADVSVGNSNQLQMLLLALAGWALLARGPLVRDVGAGLVLGLAALFKPTLALVPLLLIGSRLFERRWSAAARLALGCALGLPLAAALAYPLLGSVECWAQWISGLGALGPSTMRWQAGNYSISLLLGKISPLARAVWQTQVLAALLYVLWRRARRGSAAPVNARGQRDLLLIALGPLALILLSPLAWSHYYLLCAPLVLWLFAPLSVRGVALPKMRIVLAAVGLGLLCLPLLLAPLGLAWYEGFGYCIAALVLVLSCLADRPTSA
ncbi:MAG: glycosyltransferase 87 family protein [Candidatus Alcyoniella australis]|nr:glycosyltransferase 87 family protein [Candidatus Alcyoniella australis]